MPGFEPPTRQLSLAEVAGAVPEQWGAHYTLARLLDDLRAFAAEALQTHDLNAQLFAEEAEKSVHLLDVFLNDYDVVVMNPPYNKPKEMLFSVQRYLQKTFQYGTNDLYTAFFERAHDLLIPGGYCGAITSRTFFFLATFEQFRRQFLIPLTQLRATADLGFGILDDAAVETCATVIERSPTESSRKLPATFLRLLDAEDKQQVVYNMCRGLSDPRHQCRVFVVWQDDFTLTPRCSLAYWAPHRLLELFSNHAPFGEVFGDVRMGLSTANDERFLRYVWEMSGQKTPPIQRWVPHAKGGEFSRYYQDLYLAIDWLDNGKVLKVSEGAVIRNAAYYFKEGLTYPHDTVKGLNVRYLPPNATFGAKGLGIFVNEPANLWFVLGYLNSILAQQLMLFMTPSRSWEVGLMQQLPCKVPPNPQQSVVSINAQTIFALKASWDTGNETCTRFDAPWLIQAHQGTLLAGATTELEIPNTQYPISKVQPLTSNLQSLLDHVCSVETVADARLQQLQAQIDEAVYDLYEISPEDRALIERELGDRPPELVWPQLEGKSNKEKRREHVRRLVSYFLLQALQEKRDGILPLTPGAGQTTALDEVRRGMEAEFGEDAAFRMETEIKPVLGQSFADWLDGPFFKWHTQLYKRCPIIWHLASPRNLFACFVYIHKLDRDTLRKVQTLYLWPRRRAAEAELEAARAEKAHRRIDQAEALLDDLAEFEKRLLAVIQGEVECDTPDWAEGPYRGGVYDPVLDDGVKVNITPLQEGEVLRYRKVV
ncbi:MAG: hypothetical protein FJ014_02480 [Chloroflexi bacterium]|nr:hypothetical protein [Chloroflexota bacterium]